MRQVGRCDAGAMIANANGELLAGHARGDLDRRSERGVLRGVFEQVGQRGCGQARIQPHRDVGLYRDFHGVALQRVLDLIASGRDDLRWMRPARLGRHRAGIDARHLENILE
jgi:hypothetical protein